MRLTLSEDDGIVSETINNGPPIFFFSPRFFPHVYDDLLRPRSFYQSWACPPAALLGPLVRICEVEGPGKTGFCIVSTPTSITLVETTVFPPLFPLFFLFVKALYLGRWEWTVLSSQINATTSGLLSTTRQRHGLSPVVQLTLDLG